MLKALYLCASLLTVATYTNGSDNNCVKCGDQRTRIPVVDNSDVGLGAIFRVAQKAKGGPESIDCREKLTKTSVIFYYGKFHQYTKECRNFKRRHSLNKRGLDMTSDEKLFWETKDKIQILRDRIRVEAIKLGFEVMDDKNAKYVDVTRNPKILEMMMEHERLLKTLESEQERLASKYKGKDAKRYDAYVEQGLVLKVKDASFRMNLENARQKFISGWMLSYDPKANKLFFQMNKSKDPKEIRKAMDEIFDLALNDNRDPKKHHDHFLNNSVLLEELKKILRKDRCKDPKKECMGYNNMGIPYQMKGKSDEENIQDVLQLKKKDSTDLIYKKLNNLPYDAQMAHNLYGYKNDKFFTDVDGINLYYLTMARSHYTFSARGNWDFPETTTDSKKKSVLIKMYELDSNRLSDDEKRILSETKSLTDHDELTVDISKWYRSGVGVTEGKKYRPLYLSDSPGESQDYTKLRY